MLGAHIGNHYKYTSVSALISVYYYYCRSTLIYVRSTNTIHHYDSFRPSNLSAAKQCAHRVTPFLECKSCFHVSIQRIFDILS